MNLTFLGTDLDHNLVHITNYNKESLNDYYIDTYTFAVNSVTRLVFIVSVYKIEVRLVIDQYFKQTLKQTVLTIHEAFSSDNKKQIQLFIDEYTPKIISSFNNCISNDAVGGLVKLKQIMEKASLFT